MFAARLRYCIANNAAGSLREPLSDPFLIARTPRRTVAMVVDPALALVAAALVDATPLSALRSPEVPRAR